MKSSEKRKINLKSKKVLVLQMCVSVFLFSCGVQNPNLVGVSKPVSQPSPIVSTTVTTSKFFPLVTSENSFVQSGALTNETTALVQIERKGTNVKAFTKDDFILMENSKPVTNFDFSIDDTKAEQVVDIAFVVDVTGSMAPFIESAKVRLTEFIKSARSRGYHTRMCLSTFGDHTVQKCDKFYDNDPKDTTEAQTRELISEIAKLRALKGNLDPGGRDIPENSMRALMDAGASAWRSDAQKFVILVTDADFLYSPDRLGDLEATKGILPPTMAEVHASLEASQVTVMAVTPNGPGYTSKFQGLSSIVEKSNGEHFLFRSVILKPAILDDIFDRIISRVEGTYRLTYDAEEFDANHSTLPIDQRKITVELRDKTSGEIKDTKVTAQYPDGRPQYTSSWTLADKDVNTLDIQVTVNEEKVDSSQYDVIGATLKFKTPPPPNSRIKAVFYYQDVYSNLRLEPVSLNGSMQEAALKITLNGVAVRKKDVQIARDISKNISITLLPSVAADDFYKITDVGGIAFRVE